MPLVLPISVVVPSLGGLHVLQTIQCLNSGQAIPAEILVCLPYDYDQSLAIYTHHPNVSFHVSPFRGQVAQRSYGFSMVAQPFTMQLDDDVQLAPSCLATLFQLLCQKGPGNILAPYLVRDFRLTPYTQYKPGFFTYIRDFVISLACGAAFGKRRMGSISASGIAFGLLPTSSPTGTVECDWLPGGAILCHTSDLITNDYYPFSGKAYTEDLVHSILWRRQGCRLWTASDAYGITQLSPYNFNIPSLFSRFRAHLFVSRLQGHLGVHTFIWFLFSCVSSFFAAFRRSLKPGSI